MTDDMLLYIVCPALLWIFIIIDFIHLNFKNKRDIILFLCRIGVILLFTLICVYVYFKEVH